MSDAQTPAGTPPQGAGNKTGIFLALAGLLVLCAALYWGFLQEPETPPPATTQTPVTPEVEIEVEKIVAAPVQPEAEPAVPEAPEPEVPVEVEPPPISLGESDGVLAETMASINAGQLGEQFIMRPNGLERGVAIVDNLRQGAVPYKLLPVGRPSKAFPFSDNGLAVTMDPVGFERYNGLADTIAGIDVPATLALYDLLSVAIEEAWDALGYTDTGFEDAVLSTLGAIMLTPATNVEARLIKDESNWIYEDEALESLSALQKQIMRMGPENADKIQAKARELRGALMDREE